ncbi:MAG: tetraacyldisaccharide 4'-kinase [Pyrinomonadaceae bacterium]
MQPLSRLYGAIIKARNSFYEKGVLKSFSLGVPTVSIGNITVGGTGKTPLVAWVAGFLAERGERVCVLTRGYGRQNPKERIVVSDGERILSDPTRSGDEPVELARKLFGKALVIADADRVGAGNWARNRFGVTAFVLDDAFQHLRVKRDLDIVVIDATDPFGNDRLLPNGTLRESPENLGRAGLIVITRTNLSDRTEELKERISGYNPNCPILRAENKTARLIKLEDFQIEAESANNPKSKIQNPKSKSLAFCALGNPENFFEQLRREKIPLAATEKFPDHHFYRPKDIARLEMKAAATGAENMLTTAKDAVKLKDLKFDLPCYVLEIGLAFDDEKKLRRIISDAVLKKNG